MKSSIPTAVEAYGKDVKFINKLLVQLGDEIQAQIAEGKKEDFTFSRANILRTMIMKKLQAKYHRETTVMALKESAQILDGLDISIKAVTKEIEPSQEASENIVSKDVQLVVTLYREGLPALSFAMDSANSAVQADNVLADHLGNLIGQMVAKHINQAFSGNEKPVEGSIVVSPTTT